LIKGNITARYVFPRRKRLIRAVVITVLVHDMHRI